MEQEKSVIGVEASASKDNAYYVSGCNHAQHRPPYAACLDKISARKHGRLESRPECSAAIGRKDCPALAMRRKELEKGEAMFFISRSEMQAKFQAQAEESGQRILQMMEGRDWAKPSKRSARKASASTPAAPTPAPTDYASAINAALTKASTVNAAAAPKPAPVAAPTVPKQPVIAKEPDKAGVKLSVSAYLSKPTAGMSMLDFARLAKQRNQTNATTA